MKRLFLFILLFVSIAAKEEIIEPEPYRSPRVESVKVLPHKDLALLRTDFRNKVIILIKNCHDKYNITLRVRETLRDSIRQDSLAKNGRRVTNLRSGESRHQWGLAVDLVGPRNRSQWLLVGREGESLGLRWGGRWRHPYDPYHFEEKLKTEELATSKQLFKTDTVLIPI